MILAPVLISLLAAPPDGEAQRPFAIEVIDDATGRGVPLVELRTVNDIRFVTDSSGMAAVAEPGLMDGARVFFHVSSHGYEFPKDGFGYRGKALDGPRRRIGAVEGPADQHRRAALPGHGGRNLPRQCAPRSACADPGTAP